MEKYIGVYIMSFSNRELSGNLFISLGGRGRSFFDRRLLVSLFSGGRRGGGAV